MVKYFYASSASALESDINTFLEGKTLVDIEFMTDHGWYAALVGYTEAAADAAES